MPPLRDSRRRDNDHGQYHDPTDDEETFDNNFQSEMQRHFFQRHQLVHATAHERAMRRHRRAVAGHDHGEYHDHQMENHLDSDPEEADIDEHEYHAPNNLHVYRTVATNFRPSRQSAQASQSQPGSDAGRRPGTVEPSDAQSVFSMFTQMVHGFRDSQTGRSGTETLFSSDASNGSNSSNRSSGTRGPGAPRDRAANTRFGATSFTIATGPLRHEQVEHADFNTVLGNILGQVGPPDVEEQNPQAAGLFPPGFPTAMQQIIFAVLSGRGDANFQSGDAVHSDEALDRIITMLMETGQRSSGAPPASQNALDELDRKKVDQDMLGSEGHAECTICISDVELGEEVLQLPCKHWFHEECVVMWLKQHNTCPVCRNPVVYQGDGSANANPASQSTPESASASGGSSAGNPGNAGNASSAANAANANTGGSAFDRTIPELLSRGLFFNVTRNSPGTTDPAGDSASGSPRSASISTGTSSSAAPNPHPPSLRLRAQRNQDMALQRERFNAIRNTAGLPPVAHSTTYPDGVDIVFNGNPYRTPRERSAAAERERRRRDSHSPDPGHNVPSRRYNPGLPAMSPVDAEDWQASGSYSRNLRNASNEARPRSTLFGMGSTPPISNTDQSPRRRFSLSRRAPTLYTSHSTDNDSGTGMDGANDGTNWPGLSRSSTMQSRHSMFSDPAPDTGSSSRPYVQITGSATSPTMISFPAGVPGHFGGDGNGDGLARDSMYGRDEARSSSRRNSNSQGGNNSGNGNANGNNNGNNGNGGGGLFAFLRRR